MSNVKSKIALGLVMLLVVMSLSVAFADVLRIFTLTAKFNGKELTDGQTITLDSSVTSRTIDITVNPKYVDDTLKIGYAWDNGQVKVAASGTKTASITIPSFEAGSTHTLAMEALIKDNNHKYNEEHNYVGNSNVVKVTFKVPAAGETKVSVSAKVNGNQVANGAKVSLPVGGNIVATGSATNNKKVAIIAYAWDKGNLVKVGSASDPKSTATIVVPSNFEAGSTHKLEIQACSEDNKYSPAFNLSVEIPTSDKAVVVKYKGNRLTDGGYPIKVDSSSINVEVSGSPAGDFSELVYTLNNGRSEETADPKGKTIKIDFEPGQTKTLQIYGVLKDNTQTPVTKYNFVWDYTPENDDLIVEDYMKENKDLDVLAVSLRNDSDEYDKENKNVYALGEEVVYYVDYKNGGNDIKKEVKIVLQLPLEFDAISTYGGKVDQDKKTITWTFADGLEKDAAGTKIVKVSYVDLSRKSKKAEIVYPVAKIYNANKEKDASAVINYIFRSEDTEIGDEHYPYMYGDKNKTTFRPDDGISRAEGALVLARIFGINYTGTTVVGDEYADLADTYIEAQRAIVACSKIGIINGYTDGTYRPNNKMTRAEFMKIIASYVEVNAEDDDVDGLEVKTDSLIKVYKNPTNVYMTGSTTTSTHWAINYVTLLCRLNMTSVSDSNKNLRLDDEITRAEVAQLVNFYLLRAPAESGKTQFSDVAKNHKLFADILEATRPAHTYYLTSEGTEVAEYDD